MMCGITGKSRSAFYKRSMRGKAQRLEREAIIKLVQKVREDEPRTGTRKLHHRIQPKLDAQGTHIGRDKLFAVLREEEMLVRRKKRYEKTTYSNHGYAVAPNRFKDLVVDKPMQALVSDITYIRLCRGFAYLFLVTDVCSRKIVGFHLSRDLGHHSAIMALGMALTGVSDAQGLVHHSDRGCQYCCHEFLNFLKEKGVIPSMTDENHCYQNAIAERVNGILKNEFNLDSTFQTFDDAKKALVRAVLIYNNKRTHWSLGLKTPAEVFALAA